MSANITEIANRIKTLREDLDIPLSDMATVTNVTPEEYGVLESGETDFSFTFLHHCANRLGVDIIELLTGENPHLTGYSVTRAGEGLPIKRRAGFAYEHLAATFRGKRVEPFVVRAPYSEDEQAKPVALSTHEGQEFDYILSGSLKVVINGHTELLNPGDSIIYDSGKPHGMIAAGGAQCVFLAFVF